MEVSWSTLRYTMLVLVEASLTTHTHTRTHTIERTMVLCRPGSDQHSIPKSSFDTCVRKNYRITISGTVFPKFRKRVGSKATTWYHTITTKRSSSSLFRSILFLIKRSLHPQQSNYPLNDNFNNHNSHGKYYGKTY
jgi:hypothetical protein